MISGKHTLVLMILIILLPLAFEGTQTAEDPQMAVDMDPGIKPMSRSESTLVTMIEDDPIIGLLGMRFEEIGVALGDPDDEGYHEVVFGPHHYMHYSSEGGSIRFLSPATVEDPTVASIILGPGREILGVEVGMQFEEILSIWGSPDSGPELGMDDIYYMDYFFGEASYGIPDIVISFSAECLDCPTKDAFIKREDFAGGHVASVR